MSNRHEDRTPRATLIATLVGGALGGAAVWSAWGSSGSPQLVGPVVVGSLVVAVALNLALERRLGPARLDPPDLAGEIAEREEPSTQRRESPTDAGSPASDIT